MSRHVGRISAVAMSAVFVVILVAVFRDQADENRRWEELRVQLQKDGCKRTGYVGRLGNVPIFTCPDGNVVRGKTGW